MKARFERGAEAIFKARSPARHNAGREHSKFFRILGVSLGAGLLAGCASVGPDYRAPSLAQQSGPLLPELPEREAGDPLLVRSQEAGSDWWRWFGSAELNRLVEAGFATNPSLSAARARLTQAAFQLRAEEGLEFPEIAANANASRQLFGSGGFAAGGAGAGGGGNQPFTIYSGQLTVDYNLDPFGREDRRIESARAQLAAARAEAQSAYLTLAGNIVATAIEAAAIRERLDVTRQLVEGQNALVELVRLRVEEGYSARAELVAAEARVGALEAGIPLLQRDLRRAETRLAILIGRVPAQASLPRLALADLAMPDAIAITVPTVLLKERPDIQAAEARLGAASAEIGVATAALYPDFTLSGALGANGITGSGIGPTLDFIYSAGIGLLAPIFQGGRLRAQRDAQVAAYKASLAEYQDVVLGAFGEVNEGIEALRVDGDLFRERLGALAAAQESLDLAVLRYREGATSLFEVFQVEQTYQDARLALVDAAALRLQDTAGLLAAMAAGPVDRAVLDRMTGPGSIARMREALAEGRPPAVLPRNNPERILIHDE